MDGWMDEWIVSMLVCWYVGLLSCAMLLYALPSYGRFATYVVYAVYVWMGGWMDG